MPHAAVHAGSGHGSAGGDVLLQYGTQVRRVTLDQGSTEFGAGGSFGVWICGGER